MSKYYHKTLNHEVPTQPIHVKYLEKMARIVQEKTGFYQPMSVYEYVNPPFRMGFRGIETMLARVDMGVCESMGIGSMSVSGISTPITVTGLAVVAVAEIIAALTLFRILRPGYGLLSVAATGSLDLRTARVNYFSMHTHLGNLAAWELITRGLGVDSKCLSWYRDANEPGMQAMYEFGLGQTLFSSVFKSIYPEIGGLSSGAVFSPEQAVMDMEIIKEFDEFAYGFEYDENTVGYEEILSAGFDQSIHMSTEHTVKYMHDNLTFSNFLFKGLSPGAHHNKEFNQTQELMKKAAEKVRNAKKKGREMEPNKELSSELYECVKEAAGELGIECPELI